VVDHLESQLPQLANGALYGTILLELKWPAEAAKHLVEALRRTPGGPMAVYGIARAAEALGDRSTALERYTQFLELWKHTDHDRPELAIARRFIKAGGRS
jgi:predicted Zn-dependent protease